MDDDGDELERLLRAGTRARARVRRRGRDEEGLERALERLDPEIFLLSPRRPRTTRTTLERVLDLLPDVPAGKLAIAELDGATRDEVVALERAGVDAVLVAAGERRRARRWRAPGGLSARSQLGRARGGCVGRDRSPARGRAAARRHPVRPAVRPLLNPDEQNIVPRAWRMIHGGGLDPHWFD